MAGHPRLVIDALSEEHVVIRVPASSRWSVADRIEIIPNHASLVPSLVGLLIGIRNGIVTQTIGVQARGQVR